MLCGLDQDKQTLYGRDGSSSFACLHHFCDMMWRVGGIGRRCREQCIQSETRKTRKRFTTEHISRAWRIKTRFVAVDHQPLFVGNAPPRFVLTVVLYLVRKIGVYALGWTLPYTCSILWSAIWCKPSRFSQKGISRVEKLLIDRNLPLNFISMKRHIWESIRGWNKNIDLTKNPFRRSLIPGARNAFRPLYLNQWHASIRPSIVIIPTKEGHSKKSWIAGNI